MLHEPDARMVHGGEGLARPQVLVRRQFAVAGHRREADAVFLRFVIEVPGVPLADELLHELVHEILVLGPAGDIREDVEQRPVRVAHELHQPLPLILLDANQGRSAHPWLGRCPKE